ncbi:MAG TPA: sulfotransferase [Bacteroidia bacterium]|nr:sulfotransferase [Bacteroidia bacterium]
MTTDSSETKPLTAKDIEYIKTIPMIFILGRERSGTSLLQNLLDSHPNIIGTPESKFIPLLAPRFLHIKKWTEKDIKDFAEALYIEPMFSNFWHLDKEQLTKNLLLAKDSASYGFLCKIVYYHLRRDKEKILLISDKNPSFILHIRTLLKIYPDARFVHIIREPRDNVYSQMKAFDARNTIFSAQKWLGFNQRVERFKKRMPEKFYTIIYENMVTETEAIMKGLCQFLKIPYSTAMIENVFPEWLSAHLERKGKVDMENMVHKGLLSPINTSNVGKWKGKMSAYDQAATEAVTADFARKTYGYDIQIDPTNKVKISGFKVFKGKCIYYVWQAFTQARYMSLKFNLMYSKRKQGKKGKDLPLWEHF